MTGAFLVIFLSISYVLPSLGQAKRVVGNGQDYQSVKKAIEAARAGDTVLIKSGHFTEGNILVEKPLVIIGENYPTLDGENKYEILTINSSDVIVRGLKFLNTGTSGMEDLAAVKVKSGKRIKISGNKFENSFFGIHFSNASQSVIENNELVATATGEHEIGNGIHLWKCSHITIDNNTIKGHRDGIYFEFVTRSLITNNHSEGNIRYGLHFMFSHDDEYRNNMFINNGAGVSVMYTKGVKMINNTFLKNWGASSYGMLLKDIRDSHVEGNHFIENSTGIYMEGSSRIKFLENRFTSNGYAIKLQASCDDNDFSKNNFTANTFDIATNGTLFLNNVDGNYWDRYQGYDLDKDNVGDIPFHPVSMYSMIVEQIPATVLLWRSFLVMLLDKAEKAVPVLTPENLKDNTPSMRPYDLDKKG